MCVAIVLCCVLFAVMPGKKRNIAPFHRTLYAHRGLHDNSGPQPENSLAAFQAAKEAGYGVELDVRFTADRQVVVFHDDTLQRMCGDPRRVDECTYAQLKELRLLDTDQHIPLLSEALEILDKTTLLCEIKAMRSYFDVSLCHATQELLAGYKGAYCIESFNPWIVRWFRKNAPHVIRGILSMRFRKGDIRPAALRPFLSSLMANFLCRPDFIAYHHTDHRHPFFHLCRLFKPATLAWTIRNPAEQATAENVFDSVIFEGFTPASKG